MVTDLDRIAHRGAHAATELYATRLQGLVTARLDGREQTAIRHVQQEHMAYGAPPARAIMEHHVTTSLEFALVLPDITENRE